MSLRGQLGKARSWVLSSMMTRSVELDPHAPLVSFCFDDFPRTAYSVGGMILRSFGVHGTFYTAPGLVNTTNALGDQFTPADIDALLSDGHELGCHSFGHVSCRALSLRSFQKDVRRGRHALLSMTGCDPTNFAYPFGHVSLRSKHVIGSEMASCRGTCGGINERLIDLNLLRANSLYGDVDQFAAAESLISETAQRQGWLIFYTHDVREHPSPFGCTPGLLDRTLLLALEKGCRIVSVREVLDTLPAPASAHPSAALAHSI